MSENPKPAPEITSEMIKTTFKALELRGMVYYSEGGVYVPTETGWKLLMKFKPVKEEIIAYGHPNVLATHTTTFQITKEEDVKKHGDCIVAVKADKACRDLSKELRNVLKESVKVEITLEVDGVSDTIIAYGSPALKITHPTDIVVRKSDFIDNRTLAILANKSANELKQDLIEKLRNPNTKVKIDLEIK